MNALMIDSGGPPHEAAKYDGDHRCSRCLRTKYRVRSRLDETPLREFNQSRELHSGRVHDEKVHVIILAVHCVRAAGVTPHCPEDLSQ
jgi:hypothetical protein